MARINTIALKIQKSSIICILRIDYTAMV